MSEIIDRVARVLYEASISHLPDRQNQRRWETMAEWDYMRRVFLGYARAAIEAMREPTPEPRKILAGRKEELCPTHAEADAEIFRTKWNARLEEGLK